MECLRVECSFNLLFRCNIHFPTGLLDYVVNMDSGSPLVLGIMVSGIVVLLEAVSPPKGVICNYNTAKLLLCVYESCSDYKDNQYQLLISSFSKE